MTPNTHNGYGSVVASTWINDRAVDIVFAATAVVLLASAVAMSIGEPELIAFTACVGIAVLLAVRALLGATAPESRSRSLLPYLFEGIRSWWLRGCGTKISYGPFVPNNQR